MSMLMSSNERPASLRYGPNGYKVLSAGSFVLCAVTGERVQLEILRYWSVARQEAYVDAASATRRLTGTA
jgi:hypothetical protein